MPSEEPPNPYSPTPFRRDFASFAGKYRSDNSKTSLLEFCRLSRSWFIGPLYWISLRLGIIKFQEHILDGPQPLKDDECPFEEIHESVRPYLEETQRTAERLGFHSPRPSKHDTQGVEVRGGVVRMLHESSKMFLQIIASSAANGSFFEGAVIISSATSDSPPTVLSTTDFRKSFRLPKQVIVRRRRRASLEYLYNKHLQWLDSMDDEVVSFRNYNDVATILDHLTIVFFVDKVERGIFVAVDEPPAGRV